MPLVSSLSLLKDAQKNHYAVGAFNCENMEMVQAAIAAAEKMHSPVLIQTTPGTLSYANCETFYGIVSQLAKQSSAPIALHLDHGSSFELAKRALNAGYTSIMIDGSKLPYEENVALSKSVVDIAGDVPVEAELGTVGGKEDTTVADSVQYTDPAQAEDFVKRTGISMFAPAIGTSHGFYKGDPKLNLDLLSQIQARVDVPLVLHGTSGVPDEKVVECIKRGICKVNYATELRVEFTKGVKEAFAKNPDLYDPKKYCGLGRQYVEDRMCNRMKVLGSANRA